MLVTNPISSVDVVDVDIDLLDTTMPYFDCIIPVSLIYGDNSDTSDYVIPSTNVRFVNTNSQRAAKFQIVPPGDT